MHPSLRLLTRVSILLGSIAAVSQAATLTWDVDGAATTATGGTGAWDQVSPFWGLNGVFAPWNNVTNANDTALFGGTAGTATLAGPISAGGLRFGVTGYTLAGANPVTLANNAVIQGDFASTGVAAIGVALAGTNLVFNNVAVDANSATLGQGHILLTASALNTGTTTINGGILELNNNVTMNTGTGIIINGSGLLHPQAAAGTGTEYPNHRLRLGMVRIDGTGDIFGAQMVTMNGGTIVRVSPAGGNDTATIQNMTLNTGDNILASGPNGGTAGDVLAITNLTRNANATVQFRSQYGTLGANGDNGKVSIGNLNGVAVANTNGILGGWGYANETGAALQGNGFATAFATWDGTLGSVKAAVPDKSSGAGGTAINQTLSTSAPTDNWLISANATITADVTVNSLIEQNDVIINSGATLKIASGGLIFRTNNFWMQSGDATGKITSLESNGNLYLNAASLVDTLTDLRLRVKVVDNGATAVRLVKAGNGTVNIGQYNSGVSTANTYSGGTIIQSGRLLAASLDAFGTGTVTVQPGGQAFLSLAGNYANAFDLSGVGATEAAGVLGAVRFANGAIITGPVSLSGTARLTAFGATEIGTITGVVSGAAGLEKTGAGLLVLGGASANTYTGDTLISAGTVRAGKADAFGPAGAGMVLVRGGGTLDTGNLDLGTKVVDIQGTGVGGAGAVVNGGAGTAVGLQRLQLSANATIGGATRWDMRGAGSTLTLNGFTLTKTGANLISLVGTSVSPGNIVVSQGNLGIEAGSSVLAAAGSSIQVNTGGFLWVHDFGTAVTVTRDITLNGGELTSNAGGANGNSVIGSNITVAAASNINVVDAGATMRLTGTVAGTAAVTKIGNGVLRVDGTFGALAGLNVNGGKLTLGATANLPANATTTIASGAQLEALGANLAVPGTSTLVVGRTGTAATDVIGNVTFGAGSTLNVGGTGTAATATFANNLTLSGSTLRFDLGSTLTPGSGVSDLVAVGGALNLSGGNITVAINQLGSLANGSYTLFTASSIVGSAANFNPIAPVANSRQTFAFDTTTVANTVLLTTSGSKALTWTGSVAGKVWDLKTTANWNDGAASDVFYNADAVTFGETGAGTVTLAGTLLPSSVTVNAAANYTFAGTGSLSGSTTLNKQGSGTLVIANTGANDFTGTTTVSSGVLQIGDGTNGKIGSGAVVNNASLVLQLAEGSTFGNVVSGTGNLTKAGNTTVNLTGASTHTGATIVNGGTLSLATVANGGAASPLGASANTADKLVLDGGSLRYTGAAASTDRLLSVGTAGGGLDASGTGALTLANTGNIGFVGTGARTFTLKGANTANNTVNFGIGDEASGATAVVKEGAGTWVLNGSNGFTGGLTINGGVLAVDGSQVNNRLANNSTVNVNNGGVFEMRGVNAIPGASMTLNVNQGGTLRVVSGGSPISGAAGTSHAHLNNINLNGGTVQLTYSGAGAAYDLESFQLDGNVTVGGTAPSTITTTLATTQQGISLNGARTFTVNDVTGSPAADLTVAAELEARDGGIVGSLVKAGAGTMVLLNQNTFAGGVVVNDGVLAVDATTGNLLPNNTAVAVNNTGVFEIRAVNAMPTGANAVDITVATGGTLRVVSGASAVSAGNSHAHIRNITMNGGNIDLRYSGTAGAYNEESFQLNGDVTVGGTAMSVINFAAGTTTATQGISLNGNRTFTVNNVTAGTDLKVFAQLENTDTTPADDGVVKAGTGTMEIAGFSDYNGPTIVTAGTFLVSGSLTGTNNVSVASTATFGGNGTVAPTGTGTIVLSAGAKFAPGVEGIGKLTVDGGTSTSVNLLSFLADSVLAFELGSGQSSDSVALVNGASKDIFFGGNTLTLSGSPSAGPYTLFSSDVPDAYDGLVLDGTGKIIAGLLLDPSFTSTYPNASLKVSGNDILLTVPEPTSALMLLGGLGLLASRRRRQA